MRPATGAAKVQFYSYITTKSLLIEKKTRKYDGVTKTKNNSLTSLCRLENLSLTAPLRWDKNEFNQPFENSSWNRKRVCLSTKDLNILQNLMDCVHFVAELPPQLFATKRQQFAKSLAEYRRV